MPLLLSRRKALNPDDFGKAFWAEIRKRAIEIARPVFEDLFFQGAELGRSITPAKAGAKDLLPIDPALIQRQLDQVLDTYVDEWWSGLQATTERGLRAAIRRATVEGTGVEGVMKDIAPLFAPARVQRIATTETSRFLGMGAQATYRASGLEEWEWQTVRDTKVCRLCQQRQGKRYPMGTDFALIHVNDRCFPKPVVPAGGLPATPARQPAAQRPLGAAGPAPKAWPAKGFKTRFEVEEFLMKEFPETEVSLIGITDVKVANAVGKEFHRLSSKYPEVQKRLKYLGTNVEATAGKNGAQQYIRQFKDPINDYGHATTDGFTISLNPMWFGLSDAEFRKRYALDEMIGWHPGQADPGNYAAILTHEYGHQMQFLLESRSYRQVTSAVRASGFGAVRDTFNMWAEKNRPVGISTYGDKNWWEGWAESFVVNERGVAKDKRKAFVRKQRDLLAALDPSKWRHEGNPVFTTDIRQDAAALRKANDELAELARKLGFKLEEV